MVIADFAVVCKCDHRGCGRPAYYVLTGHRLDDCTRPLGMLLCSQHTAELLQRYVDLLPGRCHSCGKFYTKLSELVETSHLNKTSVEL